MHFFLKRGNVEYIPLYPNRAHFSEASSALLIFFFPRLVFAEFFVNLLKGQPRSYRNARLFSAHLENNWRKITKSLQSVLVLKDF